MEGDKTIRPRKKKPNLSFKSGHAYEDVAVDGHESRQRIELFNFTSLGKLIV